MLKSAFLILKSVKSLISLRQQRLNDLVPGSLERLQHLHCSQARSLGAHFRCGEIQALAMGFPPSSETVLVLSFGEHLNSFSMLFCWRKPFFCKPAWTHICMILWGHMAQKLFRISREAPLSGAARNYVNLLRSGSVPLFQRLCQKAVSRASREKCVACTGRHASRPRAVEYTIRPKREKVRN